MYSCGPTASTADSRTGEDRGTKDGWVSGRQPHHRGPFRLSAYLLCANMPPRTRTWLVKVVGLTRAHLEFGSFKFEFEKDAVFFPNLRKERGSNGDQASAATVDLQRYFDLFAERQLAYDLFTLSEDTRLDSRVLYEYKGIRKSYRLTQDDALTQRGHHSLPAGGG